jgi:hypothetical protein
MMHCLTVVLQTILNDVWHSIEGATVLVVHGTQVRIEPVIGRASVPCADSQIVPNVCLLSGD